ncbi:MAG: NADH-quinone oxidoreductase subunit NuoK [Myxococcales bacterium]|nr:NADH-quinone oxidoreductase subunit NuoK [Myxococcales bacterium]
MRSLDIFLLLSLGLFSIGLVGVLLRRNALFILMSVELMLNGANLAFVAFARSHAQSLPAAMTGHIAVLVIITVAAVEAAVGIALVVSLFRSTQGNIHVDTLGELQG